MLNFSRLQFEAVCTSTLKLDPWTQNGDVATSVSFIAVSG